MMKIVYYEDEFWPIPQTEIDRNSPELKQNGGYWQGTARICDIFYLVRQRIGRAFSPALFFKKALGFAFQE